MYNEFNEMKNRIVKLKKGNNFIEVGKNRKTLVNCLIGANDSASYINELKKIEKILEIPEKPELISDLSIKRKKISEILVNQLINC